MLEVCGSSLFWQLLPVGGFGLEACQGFLVREAYIDVLVGGARSLSLGCNEVSSSEFWGVYGFDMSLSHLSFNVHCCVLVSWRIMLWYVLLWNLLALGWSLVSV